jgi:hypothetical protein
MAGVPVTGAEMVVTLVDERGTIVDAINAVPLTDVTGEAGNYSGMITAAFTAPAGDYFLQITAVKGVSNYYTEQPVRVPYLTITDTSDGLCTVAALKSWFNLPNTPSDKDALYQRVIGRFTAYALNECNRTAFLSQTYTEHFNGTWGYKICPKYAFPTSPITAVSLVTVDSGIIPPAASDTASGFVFDDSTIYLRGYTFTKGIQNVGVSYTAGLASIPTELEHAALEACIYWLKRREYVGQDIVNLGNQTVTFDKADIPTSVRNVLDQYMRRK